MPSVSMRPTIHPQHDRMEKNLKNSALTPGHSLRFQTYQNPLFSIQTNLGDMII